MSIDELKSLEKDLKNLLLFNSVWENKDKQKRFSKDQVERIAVYRDLIWNSFTSVLSSIYPFTKKIIGKNWKKLLNSYIEECPPTSAILIDIGAEFPDYLYNNEGILKDYPYIAELAFYEWAELQVFNYGKIKEKEKVNSASVICSFEYPIANIVHKMKNNINLPKTIEKQESNLIIYRNPETNAVKAFELTAGTKAYLDLAKEGFSQTKIKETMQKAFNITNKESFEKDFNNITYELKRQNILY